MYKKHCIEEKLRSVKLYESGHGSDRIGLELGVNSREIRRWLRSYAAVAQQTLFDLVSKRDAAYTKSTNTGTALLDEIFLQSRIELWGEGHEFFTNKRFNVGVNRTTGATNHGHKVNKSAGKEFTYQIPLSLEISNNPFITAADQNPL